MNRNSGFNNFINFSNSPLLRGCGLFSIFGRVNYSQQVALLRILAVAAEKQLSFIDVLETFSKDVRGHWKYQILHLVDLLRSGVSLADAIEKIPRVIPADAYFLVKAGAESGTLPSALAMAVEVCAERRNERDLFRSGFLMYMGLIVIITALILGFISYWIVPKLKHIFYDFNVELPPLTIGVIRSSDWFVDSFPMVVGILIVFAITVMVLIKKGFLELGSKRISSPYMYPRGRAPDVLHFLHIVTESGRPLLGAFETLTHTTKNRFLLQQFHAILDDIRKGNDCWTALHDYDLLSPSEVRLLQSAQRAGNLSWALKAVAKSIERRINYRMVLIREYLEPAMILIVGCVVGVFVIGLFLPLVTLMHSLA
ncbi:MAG: type II secretion system F family protein [Gimesia sp.]